MINAVSRVVYRLYLFCVQIGPLWLLILAAFGSSLGLLLRRRVGRGLVSQRRALCQWMLWFYLAFILIQTVFSRRVLFGADAPLAERIDLRVFSSWGDKLTYNIDTRMEFALNLLLLLPVGRLWRPSLQKPFWMLFVFGTLLSLGIESSQLLLRIGYFEIADFVENVIGLCIGFGLYLLRERRLCRKHA